MRNETRTITMQEFKLLHANEQEEIIYERAVFLANYVRGNKICDVYQLVNFYVKCCYLLSAPGNAIITAFVDPVNLPFLKQINITNP